MNYWRLLTATALLGSMAAFAPASAQETEQTATNSQETEQATSTSEGQIGSKDGADVIALPEWHYDELYAGGVSVSELLGEDVLGPTGEDIGGVENIVFGADGKVLSVIAEVGGILDIGDTHVSVPWDEVEIAEETEAAEGTEPEGVRLPITQETVEDYSIFTESRLLAGEATETTVAVEGDAFGVVDTGPRAWRATALIGDYARLRDGEAWANYGYVDDLIIRDGQIEAVVVNPDYAWGVGGYYAYPYYGYPYGWDPALAYYDLPYDREEVGEVEEFDPEQMDL